MWLFHSGCVRGTVRCLYIQHHQQLHTPRDTVLCPCYCWHTRGCFSNSAYFALAEINSMLGDLCQTHRQKFTFAVPQLGAVVGACVHCGAAILPDVGKHTDMAWKYSACRLAPQLLRFLASFGLYVCVKARGQTVAGGSFRAGHVRRIAPCSAASPTRMPRSVKKMPRRTAQSPRALQPRCPRSLRRIPRQLWRAVGVLRAVLPVPYSACFLLTARMLPEPKKLTGHRPSFTKTKTA